MSYSSSSCCFQVFCSSAHRGTADRGHRSLNATSSTDTLKFKNLNQRLVSLGDLAHPADDFAQFSSINFSPNLFIFSGWLRRRDIAHSIVAEELSVAAPINVCKGMVSLRMRPCFSTGMTKTFKDQEEDIKQRLLTEIIPLIITSESNSGSVSCSDNKIWSCHVKAA